MLKSLQLAGFKSFAEKTRLEFPAGVTVVVGPNGSGKSNVVDAVKWVLGSQSPRSLRGKEMTDVIFNGSESRGPMNAAEVTLAFDNTLPPEGGRRLFDFDEEEIRLTRRVSRSGDGEYLVNGRTCRLKDFRELLAGTGVGADSYSIIEQGRVDAALRASPLERRLLLEEAAGISRFRLKKREAGKRLERVEQNLLRLSDIVDEVEGRLRRVRSQAGKARRYREASLRLKQARTELATADWGKLAAERRRLDSERIDLTQRLEAAQAAIAEEEQRLEQLEQATSGDQQAETAWRDAQQRLARAERVAAIAQVESSRSAERVDQATTALLAARRELAAAQPSEETRQALAAAEATDAEYATTVTEAEQNLADCREQFEQATRRHERQASRRARIESIQARLTSRLDRLRIAGDKAVEALKRLAGEGEVALLRASEAAEQLAAASDDRDAATDALLRIDEQIGSHQRGMASARRELTETQSRLAEVQATLVGQRHRLEVILEEERRLERLNDDVAGVVSRGSAKGLPTPAVHGLVADLLHVEEDFVPLIEAAIGEHAEHVVIDSRTHLLNILATLGESDTLSSRAVFQTLDTPTPATALDQLDLSDEPGVVGRATEYVEVEPRFAPLVRRLLGRTWFVDSLSVAGRLASSVGGGVTFVTLAGEVLAADGGIHCGPSNASLRMLTRRQDALALQRQIAEGQQTTQAGETRAAELLQAIEAAETALEQFQQNAVEQRQRLAEAAQQAAALDERRRNAATSVERLRRQHADRLVAWKQGEPAIATLTSRGDRLTQATAQEGETPAAAAELVRQAESRVAGETARLAELRAAAQRHHELLASIRREAAVGAPAGHEELVGAIDTASQTLAEQRTLAATADCHALNAAAFVSRLAAEVDQAAQQARLSRVARAVADRVRTELATSVAQGRAELDTLARRRGEVELRGQRADLEAATVAQRVRDDYGIDVTLPASDTGDQPIDAAALRQEIEQLRGEVQAVGAVNLEALDELDALETRYEQLSSQYEDLSQAKKSLARLTSRIDADSRELFDATFETVRDNFRELFSRLFGGGEADLVLVDPPGEATGDDLLDRGVEIVACPPGKELRSLSLMSGGEKTMTCVALLLALFRSRPSPFCLLDEVDAALDEANVGRFLEVLKDFLGSTQFLVISHSKRTMSGADTIYGVTMQESGVSKQVSVRFEDVAEDGTIRLRRSDASGPMKRAA